MPMSDKVLRAINKGRRKAGLKPIRRKGDQKPKTEQQERYERQQKESKSQMELSQTEIEKRIKKAGYYHKADGSGTYLKDGHYINMENYALDFSVPYRYGGKITKTGQVVLYSPMNAKEHKKLAKIRYDKANNEIKLAVDGNRYSIKL